MNGEKQFVMTGEEELVMNSGKEAEAAKSQ